MANLATFCNETVKIWDKHARELDREKQVSEELTTKARSTFETKRQVCCAAVDSAMISHANCLLVQW